MKRYAGKPISQAMVDQRVREGWSLGDALNRPRHTNCGDVLESYACRGKIRATASTKRKSESERKADWDLVKGFFE